MRCGAFCFLCVSWQKYIKVGSYSLTLPISRWHTRADCGTVHICDSCPWSWLLSMVLHFAIETPNARNAHQADLEILVSLHIQIERQSVQGNGSCMSFSVVVWFLPEGSFFAACPDYLAMLNDAPGCNTYSRLITKVDLDQILKQGQGGENKDVDERREWVENRYRKRDKRDRE